MKKIYLVLILLVLVEVQAKTQINRKTDSLVSAKFLLQQVTGEKFLDPGNKHVGFLFKNDWINGDIVLTTGEIIGNIPLKYNGNQDQLVWLTALKGQVKVDRQNIQDFYLNDFQTQYHFRKVRLSPLNDSTETFCQVAYEGKINFYIYRKTKQMTTRYETDGLFYYYYPKPVYLLNFNNQTYILSRLTISALYNAFPSLKENLKLCVKQNHIKVKNEAGFINLIKSAEDILVGK